MWVGLSRRARFCGEGWPRYSMTTPECQAYSHDYLLPDGCSCPQAEMGRPLSEAPACIDYCTVWAKTTRDYKKLCLELPGSKHYNDPRCTDLEDKLFHLDGRRLTACGCEGIWRHPELYAEPSKVPPKGRASGH